MSRNFELAQPIESGLWGAAERHSAGMPIAMPAAGAAGYAADTESMREEALRLVQQIFLLKEKEQPHVVVFVGIEQGNGCSRISASVAEALSRNSTGQVCLVEANFRSPALPGLLHTTNHYGLTDALLNRGPIRAFARPLDNDQKLWLLSSGALAVDSASLLSSEAFKTRLAELRGEFEFVIVDAPPLTHYSDAIAAGQLADGLVLVLEAGATRREAAQMAAANLRTSKIPILGAVLNNRTFPIPEKLYKRL